MALRKVNEKSEKIKQKIKKYKSLMKVKFSRARLLEGNRKNAFPNRK
jgi:hypothetical protein